MAMVHINSQQSGNPLTLIVAKITYYFNENETPCPDDYNNDFANISWISVMFNF